MNFAPLGNKRRRDEKKTQGWTHGMVLALLKNRAVIGEWQPFTRTRQDEEGNKLSYARKVTEGAVIEHYYPSLFSNDPHIFRRVREALAKRRGHDGKQKGDGKPYAMGGAKGRDFGNLFTGLITCQCCGGPVTKQSGPHPRKPGVKLRYLRSENYRNKQRNGCTTRLGLITTDSSGFSWGSSTRICARCWPRGSERRAGERAIGGSPVPYRVPDS